MLMEHTTKFQPNKAVFVHSTKWRLRDTLIGENADLCLDDFRWMIFSFSLLRFLLMTYVLAHFCFKIKSVLVSFFSFFFSSSFRCLLIATLLVFLVRRLWGETLHMCACVYSVFVCEVFGCICVCGPATVPCCGTQRSRGADLPWSLNMVQRGRGEVRALDTLNKQTHTP